jgi:hypothetical protein
MRGPAPSGCCGGSAKWQVGIAACAGVFEAPHDPEPVKPQRLHTSAAEHEAGVDQVPKCRDRVGVVIGHRGARVRHAAGQRVRRGPDQLVDTEVAHLARRHRAGEPGRHRAA